MTAEAIFVVVVFFAAFAGLCSLAYVAGSWFFGVNRKPWESRWWHRR